MEVAVRKEVDVDGRVNKSSDHLVTVKGVMLIKVYTRES